VPTGKLWGLSLPNGLTGGVVPIGFTQGFGTLTFPKRGKGQKPPGTLFFQKAPPKFFLEWFPLGKLPGGTKNIPSRKFFLRFELGKGLTGNFRKGLTLKWEKPPSP